MSEELRLNGRCMCGAITFAATARKPSVVVCHCDMCRRWSAGPFMSLNCAHVSFQGADSIGRVRSSAWAERGFCSKCGSNLFYKVIESNDYQIAAGLFDDQTALRLSLQVFADDKPNFYSFAENTRTMTGAEVVARFGLPSK